MSGDSQPVIIESETPIRAMDAGHFWARDPNSLDASPCIEAYKLECMDVPGVQEWMTTERMCN